MRRLLVLCLLLMLPLQGAWAVMTEISALDAPCAAAMQAALHGAHGDVVDDDDTGAMPDCLGGQATQPCCDGGCSHGPMNLPAALLGLPDLPGGTCTGGDRVARCTSGVPDHIPKQALRPPL